MIAWLLACLLVCPSVTFCVTFWSKFVRQVSQPNQLKTLPNFHQIKSLLSCTVKNCLGLCTYSRARTPREIVHPIFAYFLDQFFYILKPFLTENEKNWGHSPDRYWCDAPFSLYSLFSFQSGTPSKWPKHVKNGEKYTFLAT